jgi:uncharacterized protein YjdB
MLPKLLAFVFISTTALADIVNISPSPMDFGNQFVGSRSSQPVTLSNSTKKLLNIGSITATGNFFVSGNPCGTTLGPGAQCMFYVVFGPAAAGTQTGLLSVNDDANDTPQKVRLSGNGIAVVLTSIAVAPVTSTAPLGLTQQFTAIGTYNNGSSQDITGTAVWSSGSPSVATINAGGLASALAQGTAAITASAGGIVGSGTLTVGPPVLVSISVSPASATAKKGTTLQLAATGVYSDHSTTSLTAASQWSSLSLSIATVSASGLVSALAPGTATIRASYANLHATSSITVPQPVPVSGAIVPDSFFVPLGTPQQFNCQLTYDDGSTAIFTSPLLLWNSSSPAVCSVDSSGLATCGNLGTVTIRTNLCGGASARLDSPLTEPRNNMSSPRYQHAGTLLADGRALITGGIDSSSPTITGADVFDPSTRIFSPTGSMISPRSNHTATLLPNGQVLIAGGFSGTADLSSAELYDPATGLFTPTGSLNIARHGHSATLLQNGTVLIVGGGSTAAELYDPAAGTFTETGSMSVQRYKGTATLLGNGKVLFTGGIDGSGVYVATAELFDPSTGTFSGTGSMSAARAYHTASLLNNGTVFIAGGYNGTLTLASTEIYDPASGVFTPAGSLFTGRNAHASTVLPSGKVLVSGGESQTGYLDSGEIFDPASGSFVMPGILGTLHYPGPGVAHTATLLGTGQVLIVGGFFRGISLLGAELFVPQP